MLKNTDIQNFLTRHRAKLNPEEFGFSPNNRRVKGLRREEVAQLAAVSVSWYTWLEQGRNIRISPVALKRIGKVLLLTDTELSYLEGMVLGGNESRQKDVTLPREITAMVDGLNPHPAFIRNDSLDILYWNESAKKSIFDWSEISVSERNSIKLLFLNPDYRKKIYDWEKAARHTVSAFRTYYAKAGKTSEFEIIINELLCKSHEFRDMWDDHNVNVIGSGQKELVENNGVVNSYTYTSLELEQLPGVYLIFYLKI
ncbi:transcriptional regulator [Rahnella sp. AA]|uniref:helix-turn-helix transcriptional regulator n=1 Tax=Rahnella sp. AA TaxID=2057180 RepID=UPI000C32480A|nr:helix-turn-helix transcriptional regulator [Rahnella sp. AA]PKE30170.1 transcriptional regulator [Rahnella sp. AA]